MNEPPQSEPAAPPETEADEPKAGMKFFGKDGTKQFRPSAKMQTAIADVLQFTRAGHKPEYKIMAARHDVKPASLKRMVSLARKGKIDLGRPPDALARKKEDIHVENEKTFQFLLAYEAHLNECGMELLKLAKAAKKKGENLAFDDLGLPKVVAELKKARDLRNIVEKGNFDALQAIWDLQNRQAQLADAQANARQSMPAPVTNITQNNITVNGAPAPLVKPTPAAAAAHLSTEQERMRSILTPSKIIDLPST